jgi:LCCL domain
VTRRGVISLNAGGGDHSFRFGAAPASSDCPDDFGAFAGSTDQLACTCSAEATQRGVVWGMDVYSVRSSVCQAALHAGVIDKNGGSVTVISEAGRKAYAGVTRRGVISLNAGGADHSFRFGAPK